MRRRLLTGSVLFACGGCVSPAAVSRGARGVQSRVTPAARAFSDGTRRLVHYAGQAADDAALVARVKAALTMRKRLEEGEIRVSAEEGVIRLAGRVASVGAKHAASEVARNTIGVAGVENHLKVS